MTLEFDGPRQELPYIECIDDEGQPFSIAHENDDLPSHVNPKIPIASLPDCYLSCQNHICPYFQPLEQLIDQLCEIIFTNATNGYRLVIRATSHYKPFLSMLAKQCEALPTVNLAKDVLDPVDLLYIQAPVLETPMLIGSKEHSNSQGTSGQAAHNGLSTSSHSMSLHRRLSTSGIGNHSQPSSSMVQQESIRNTRSSSHMSQSSMIAVLITGKQTSNQSSNSDSQGAFKHHRSLHSS